MVAIDSHPTVVAARNAPPTQPPASITTAELRALCLDAGADDVGFVSLSRSEVADQKDAILACRPSTRSLISIVCRMNVEPVRAVTRSLANHEFHQTTHEVDAVARMIVAKLALRNIPAANAPVGFPMEMAGFPGKVWVVSHKPVAVAAGLGAMGIHRNVIHPRFGSFILLATILLDVDISEDSAAIDYNPCLECKLCIAACPVGAISESGFNFASCYTHNYREFMGGFTDWVENIAQSKDARAYRARVSDPETVSMWQSLAFGPNYKAAYCLAACPAGSDVIGPFLANKAGFVRDIVKPLQQREETLYVVPGTDAERHAARRFPHKRIQHVGNVLRPATIAGFIGAMQHVFQPGSSQGLDAVYHFTFTGNESRQCTVTIRNQTIEVRDGHVGAASIRISADSKAWLALLRKDRGVPRLLLTRQLRIKGSPSLLMRFAKCFPG